MWLFSIRPKAYTYVLRFVNKLTSYSCTLYLNNIMSKNFIWIPNTLAFTPQAEELNHQYPIKYAKLKLISFQWSVNRFYNT